ncbi:GH3 domain-containing protein-like [Diadema setosum]|uniref:GH3 domain-containing protein-like n=1 Tax=Diadema setosum TaxID=31175 RepID=UPI003B3B564C
MLASSLLFTYCLTLLKSPYYGITSLLRHLAVAAVSRMRGKSLMRALRRSWKRPREYQEQVLLRILAANGRTSYGKDHRLHQMTSSLEFRQQHPLTTYEHYRPYVERAMEGEKNVITGQEPASFCKTSGTTGSSKFYPYRDRLANVSNLWSKVDEVVYRNFPKFGLVQKHFLHLTAPTVSKAKCGTELVSMLTLSPKEEYKLVRYTTPPAGYRISALKESHYIHLLFALREPNLGVLKVIFLHFLESMMRQLEHLWWEDLVYDIEHGSINKAMQLDIAVRTALVGELGGGDPERARQLRAEFEKGFVGIIARVWPNLRAIISADSTKVWPEFKQTYGKGISFLPFAYGATEAFMALACWPLEERRGYTFLTSEIFFEFIKLQDVDQCQPKTYLVDELAIGEKYEVVITQFDGLYRYRLGDIIHIVDYHDNCPMMEFLYRIGLMMNVRYEKMDQRIITDSLHTAVGRWTGVKLIEFALAESKLIPKTSPAYEKDELMPYYLIFVELRHVNEMNANKPRRTSEELTMIDEEFRARNADYDRLRREDAIARPRVHIVRQGTFEELKHYLIEHTNVTANQYKVPRKLRTKEMLQVMLDNVVVQ